MKASPQKADANLDPRNLKRIRRRVREWLKQPDATKLHELWPLDDGGFNYFAFHADILYYTRVNMEEIRKPLLEFEQLGVELSPREEAFFLRLRGHLHVGTGNAREADNYYSKAWEQFSTLGDRYEQFRTAIGWTLCLSGIGEFERVDRIRAKLARWRESIPAVSLLRFDASYAISVLRRGDFIRAARLHTDTEARALEIGDEIEATISSHNLGVAYLRTGEPLRARDAFQRSYVRASKLRMEGVLLGNELCQIQIDLMLGNWSNTDARLQALAKQLGDVGHVPQAIAARKELAILLGSLGAFERAERIAADLEQTCRERGISLTQKKLMLLRSKLLLSLKRPREARRLLTELISTVRDNNNTLLSREVGLEFARALLDDGDLTKANEVLGPLLEAPDRTTYATAAFLRSISQLRAGRFTASADSAKRAHAAARHFPAILDRPAMAIVVAEAQANLGRRSQARAWLRKSVNELGQHHSAIESSPLRGDATSHATNIYQRAVELELRLGGRASTSRAVDLLSRSRSMPLLEIMLRGLEFPQRGKLASMLSARDRWIEDSTPPSEVSTELEEISREMDRSFRSAPIQVRSLMQRMRLQHWRSYLGEETVVQFDVRAPVVRAFLTRSQRSPVMIELPNARPALEKEWKSFSLTMEMLASVNEMDRKAYLARTSETATQQLSVLYSALIEPLSLEAGLVFVPDGLLHALPLEAIFEHGTGRRSGASVRRVPHPALLTVRRGRRRGVALLIHDGNEGRSSEVRSLRRSFLEYGMECLTVSTRRGLRRALKREPGIVHIAAHGSHSEENWLLNGLRLADGWIGFEEFRGGSLRDSLVYLSSCESGLIREGGAMAGWMASLFGAGASELLLTLWKIDDASGKRFAHEFYRNWLRGASARESASRARATAREENGHQFSWAPFIAVG